MNCGLHGCWVVYLNREMEKERKEKKPRKKKGSLFILFDAMDIKYIYKKKVH